MRILVIKTKSQGGISCHIRGLSGGLQSLGHHITVVEVNILNLLKFIKSILQARKIIQSGTIDIVHFHGYRSLLMSFFILNGCINASKVSKVCTIHGFLEDKSLMAKALKIVLILVANKIDKFICVSNELKEYFVRDFKVPMSKVTVIYNGVHISNFKVSRKNKVVILGACGRLTSIKGYELLIKAFNRSRNEYRMQLHIIGDGPQRGYLEEVAGEDVFFHGFLNNPLEYMEFFDVFVQPSLLEGCGMAVLEAMSLNLPVIVSNAGGLPEIVEHGENGLVFEKGDVESLIGAIKQLLSNRELYKNLGVNNKEKVKEQFSYNKMLKSTVNVYKELIGELEYEQIV